MSYKKTVNRAQLAAVSKLKRMDSFGENRDTNAALVKSNLKMSGAPIGFGRSSGINTPMTTVPSSN